MFIKLPKITFTSAEMSFCVLKIEANNNVVYSKHDNMY